MSSFSFKEDDYPDNSRVRDRATTETTSCVTVEDKHGRCNSTYGSSSSSSSASDGAMALLDKYAKMNSVIDDTRKQNEEVTTKIMHYHQQVEYLVNQTMQYKQEAAITTNNGHPQKLKRFKTWMENLKNENQQLNEKKKHLQRLHNGISLHVAQTRNDFLMRCIEFRRDWKRARVSILLQHEQLRQQHQQPETTTTISSSVSSVSPAVSLLDDAITATTTTTTTATSVFMTSLNKKRQKQQQQQQGQQNITKTDVELQQAKRLYESLISDLACKKDLHQKQLSDKEQATEKSRDRAFRLSQGKDQLKRIQQDTNAIQQELAQMQQQLSAAANCNSTTAKATTSATTTATTNVSSFALKTPAPQVRPPNNNANGVKYNSYANCLSSVTPSPLAAAATKTRTTVTPNSNNNNNNSNVIQGQNQAFERSSKSKTPPASSIKNPYAQNKNNNKSFTASARQYHNPYGKSSSQPQQHPHKVGNQSRPRHYNRQFSTTLQIDAGNSDDMQETTKPTTAHSFKRLENTSYNQNYDTIITPVTQQHPGTNATSDTTATDSHEQQQQQYYEEEDDNILSYVAFGGKE